MTDHAVHKSIMLLARWQVLFGLHYVGVSVLVITKLLGEM
jgi:hypothetical protein